MQGILERLAEGPVIGDGGFIFELEKRGVIRREEEEEVEEAEKAEE